MSWFLRKKTDCSRTLPPASSDPPCDSAAPIPPPLSIQAPSEPITLANARSCACDSEAERAGEEKEKTALRELVEKLEREKERLTTNLAATRARLSVELAAAEGRRAHCGRVVAQLAQLRTELREEQRVRTEDVAQKDAEIGTLQAALAAARDAGARRDDARERFHFVLAYNGQTGSVSRTVLASDPDSLLYTMYCGEWEYPRDENGRAIITCHPDRWAAVLEHLTTGTVPAQSDTRLLDQARYWNMGKLVRGLEVLCPGVVVRNEPDSSGFRVRCTFVPVMKTLDWKDALCFTYAAARDSWWEVKVNSDGIWHQVQPLGNDGLKSVSYLTKATKITQKCRVVLRDQDVVTEWQDTKYPGFKELAGHLSPATVPSVGSLEDYCKSKQLGFFSWRSVGSSLQQLVTQPLAQAQDGLVFEIEACFEG